MTSCCNESTCADRPRVSSLCDDYCVAGWEVRMLPNPVDLLEVPLCVADQDHERISQVVPKRCSNGVVDFHAVQVDIRGLHNELEQSLPHRDVFRDDSG